MKSPRARAGTGKLGSGRAPTARLAARKSPRSARREWNRRGLKPVRFARLKSALSILERREDGHHVVAYDPSEREIEGGRRAQRRSPRGREAPRQSRGRRVVREGDEDLDEIVRTSRKRAMRTESMAEGDVDKIQIEVGAVKALQAKHSVYRGAVWIVMLSLLLWWIPILGPAAAGYIGGRKAGTPLRAAIASLIPISIAFGSVAVFAASTAAVPAAIRHMVEAGYSGVLGSLPFDFPILGYVLSNLAAIMGSGPDALFTVLAFALVGGAVTQMKIHERMVPPITARLPASRVTLPAVQAPARALGRRQQAEVDELLAKLNDALARAEKERRGVARARGGPSRLFAWTRGRPEVRYGDPEEGGLVAESEGLDEASRQVVAEILATTPSGRADRRAKALLEPGVDLELPQTIAFASGSRAAGAEGRTAAHNYRPSKLYHVYGASVNPVARAKLEKRLRRTHTLHLMRRHARSFGEMVEVAPEGGSAQAAARELEKPRSLESSALTAEMHYDALEHLENASFDAPRRRAAAARTDEDDLGGVIAHIGEGGEAFVEERAVEDLEFGKGPVFDRRGRQRARFAGPAVEAPKAAPGVHLQAKGRSQAPVIVREAVEAVEAETGRKVMAEPHGGKSRIASSADRADMTAAQKEKVDRWLKRTLAAQDMGGQRNRPEERAAPKRDEKPEAPEAKGVPVQHEGPATAKPEERKAPARRAAAVQPAPSFEITRGSTEVDAEAASSETDSASPKKNRSASDILREIRLQRQAEKEAEAGEEIARAARQAKHDADEIERHATEGAGEAPMAMVSLKSEDGPKGEAKPSPPKKRRRSQDLEEVETDAEKLGSDLELTLAPIREESVHINEIGEPRAQAARAEERGDVAGIPMVGAHTHAVTLNEAVEEAAEHARVRPQAAPADAEQDGKPGDVVLSGPSTDLPIGDAGEGELSSADQERVRRRLQEGWNRL